MFKRFLIVCVWACYTLAAMVLAFVVYWALSGHVDQVLDNGIPFFITTCLLLTGGAINYIATGRFGLGKPPHQR